MITWNSDLHATVESVTKLLDVFIQNMPIFKIYEYVFLTNGARLQLTSNHI